MNGKHGQGTHSTKMGANKSAENNPNAPKFICPNFWDFDKKGFIRHPYSIEQITESLMTTKAKDRNSAAQYTVND